MFANDAATFLADYGDPVSWTASVGGAVRTGLMILDQPEIDVGGGELQGREYEATFAVASWPGLVRGEPLVVTGSVVGTFKLRHDPRAKDDGVFATVRLTKTG